ncbi:glycosyltransferase family 4 protein (plasmid) [Haladaptatus sp. SPP-AMP-3]|uniref:glycosyltransferase family 4 protein n=1 Tax=Haladaptatus sp. SPP-AMP-3 TaxID=3121295 RepID=UPI003C2D843A
MDVVYLVGSNKGGLPHYAAELANAVSKDVNVTVLKPKEEVDDSLFNEPVSIINAFEPTELSVVNIYNRDFQLRKNIAGMASFNEIKSIHDLDPDLVHIPTGMFPHVKLFTWYHDIAESYPTVVTRHELLSANPSLNELARFPVIAQNLLNFVLPNPDIDHTVVHTNNNKVTLTQKGMKETEISVIPHGAYDMFSKYDFEEKPTEKNTILFFGNIVPHKALDLLVKSVIQSKEKIPDIKLIIAGDGKIPTKTQQIIDNNPQNFEVHNEFIPNKKVGELFSRASVAAMPYKEQGGNKGHSGTLTIAYSFGVPAVTTSAGDFGSLVEKAEAGIVVPPGDITALARALIQILSNNERRKRMAENSKAMAERLSWDNIANQHVELYESLI